MFITTSRFTAGAKAFVTDIESKIVLHKRRCRRSEHETTAATTTAVVVLIGVKRRRRPQGGQGIHVVVARRATVPIAEARY